MTVHCTSIKDLWEKTSHLILISNLNFEYIHSQTRKLGSAMPLCLSQQSKFATNSPISFIFNFWPRDKSRFHNKTSRHKKTSRFTFEEKIHFVLGLLATDIASTKRRKRNFNSVSGPWLSSNLFHFSTTAFAPRWKPIEIQANVCARYAYLLSSLIAFSYKQPFKITKF